MAYDEVNPCYGHIGRRSDSCNIVAATSVGVMLTKKRAMQDIIDAIHSFSNEVNEVNSELERRKERIQEKLKKLKKLAKTTTEKDILNEIEELKVLMIIIIAIVVFILLLLLAKLYDIPMTSEPGPLVGGVENPVTDGGGVDYQNSVS